MRYSIMSFCLIQICFVPLHPATLIPKYFCISFSFQHTFHIPSNNTFHPLDLLSAHNPPKTLLLNQRVISRTRHVLPFNILEQSYTTNRKDFKKNYLRTNLRPSTPPLTKSTQIDSHPTMHDFHLLMKTFELSIGAIQSSKAPSSEDLEALPHISLNSTSSNSFTTMSSWNCSKGRNLTSICPL